MMVDNEEEEVLAITCGQAEGLLHKKLFKCPGIRVPCIEYNGGFITPKDFTYIGNKHTLKDWKTAIRSGGMSIRKLIDCGHLDFYDHAELCTGRCVSRKADNLLTTVNLDTDLTSLETSSASLDEHAFTVLRHMEGGEAEDSGPELAIGSVQSLAQTQNGGKGNNNMLHKITSIPTHLPVTIVKREPKDLTESSAEPGTSPTASSNGVQTYVIKPGTGAIAKVITMSKYDIAKSNQVEFESLTDSFPNVDDFLDESQQFWRSILKVGLMDTVMKDIKISLDLMCMNWTSQRDVSREDADRMSNAISGLGLTQTLKIKLAEHKTSMLRQNIKLGMEIQDLKRKLAESEKKRDENNKKSEAFESLIELGNKVKTLKSGSRPDAESPVETKVKVTKAVRVSARSVSKSSPSREDIESPAPSKRRRKSTPKKEDVDYSPSRDSDLDTE